MFQEKLGEIGKDLFQFLSRRKRKEIYVLCRFDEKDLTYYVINVKKSKEVISGSLKGAWEMLSDILGQFL